MTIDAYQLGGRIAQLALQYSGACACEPMRPRMREALSIGPTEWWDWRPFKREPLQGVSTCFVFASSILCKAGVALPWRGQPWKPGRLFSDLTGWAKANDCWQKYVEGCVPSAGDVVIIGADGGAHMLVCLDCDGVTLHSVDGGQECPFPKGASHEGIKRQAITRRERAWGGGFVRGTSVSPVVGWVVAGLCPMV